MSRVQGGLKAESQLDAGDVFSIFGEDVGLCLSFFEEDCLSTVMLFSEALWWLNMC